MNCPQCEQPVGKDSIHVGDWKPLFDANHVAVEMRRKVSIQCNCCGLFVCTQNNNDVVVKYDGPILDPKKAKKVEALLPACRLRERRIPA